MFSKEQIEEIDIIKELCHGIKVDGIPFVCFNILSDLAHCKKEFSKLSLEDLTLLDEQLFDYKDFWENADWFDNRIFLDLLPQLQKRIEFELLKYQQ